MKPEDMVRALAELDGWNSEPSLATRQEGGTWGFAAVKPEWNFTHQLPNYLTSYDAILSLIQKLHGDDGILAYNEIFEELSKICAPCECGQHWAIWVIRFSPAQLCEALLKATGRWQE